MKEKELMEKMKGAGENIVRKAKDVGRTAVLKIQEGAKWVIENPEKAAALTAFGAAITGGAGKVLRGINKNVVARQELKEKRTRIYDHSLNAYLYTKRPLKAEEIARINRLRRETGKRVSEILEEMRLLKR